ncbi:MAG: hypothetical protein H7A46_11875 [Verrucomicrobiales bacterium]|nr:hypothetical protein [Verrucomicrobiales bacterium]
MQATPWQRPLLAVMLLAPTFTPVNVLPADALPPVRAITQGPAFHWFGYYDKLEFDPTGRFVLANEVDFEGRSPKGGDVIRVGMVDLRDGDRWIELGTSRAWGWQQGCMLQWRPGSMSEVLWNDREGDRFVCRIMDVFSRKVRTIPWPIYALSPDGRSAVTAEFRRIQDMRPGYGYAGLPDPFGDQVAPTESGIHVVDLETGTARLVVSLAQAAAIPFEANPTEFDGVKHWFNHLLWNTDGTRFLFLHRWRPADGSKYRGVGGFGTRMFTCNPDGSDLFILDPNGQTSHFIWRDPDTVTAWAWHPSHGSKFYNFHDRTQKVEVVGPEVMTVNGHNTYLPGNEWILNDTYPDKARLQHPYLYHVPTGRRVPVGHFLSPPGYTGEWRCDLHPRSSPDGTKVVIDSTHDGKGRQLYLIDIGGVLGNAQ